MNDTIFNQKTLAQFNGQDGQPAYVAVDGIVYDLSEIGPWAGGKHYKGLKAGQDLTDFFANSHHTPKTLKSVPQVGTYQA